ncbi:DUF401 family protein [Natranaerobius trueperi]|uniref:DUF401 family protein n=1 Tax=Natranaerobius trueperi TaxID=759412 RepID=A0A226C2Q6_9FIRM|nr:DUF401 family protein [Natranaerobius trueperi]OWZ84729.1 hypothetical protein CDO51_01520 [Natranaerobius trueperi]
MQLLGLFIALVLIIVMLQNKKPLGLSMTLGALILGIFSGMNFSKMLKTTYNSLTDPTTVNLLLIVLCISIFGTILKQTNCLETMVTSLTKIIPNKKVLLAILPSLIGMLTVPGGAVMSAPMIKEAGDKINLPSEKLAATNLFYRHVWHLIFPLIPSIIIISELSQVPLRFFIVFNLPVFIITFIIGYKWLFRTTNIDISLVETERSSDDVFTFIKSTFPLFTAVGTAIFTPLNIPPALLIGILLASFNYIDSKHPMKSVISGVGSALKNTKYSMTLTILGIMIFKDFIETSGVVEQLTNYLITSGIPIPILIVLVPIITAGLTGVNSAALGISYPIMAPIMNPHEGNLALLGIFYTASVFGYYLSPFHLCLLLTKEYFKTSFNKLYKELVLPAGAMVLGALITGLIWNILSLE